MTKGIAYNEGENRLHIWTKYPIPKTYKTYDKYKSACADLETAKGFLIIYGIG